MSRMTKAMRWTLGVLALSGALPLPAHADSGPDSAKHRGPAIPAKITKVVTLAPSLSELVLALDAGDLLVGVTRFDDDARVARLPRIGGYNDPEPESVLKLKPDLVLAQPAPENRGPVETLGRVGIPVEAFALGTVEEIEHALTSVGALLDRKAQAAALVAAIHAARELARTRPVVLEADDVHRRDAQRGATTRPVRALLVFGFEPLVVAGRSGFAGQLLADLGAVNAAEDDRSFFRFSAEAAALSRPDVIVLCGVEETQGRTALPGLDAVPRATLRSTALLHPGPRIPEALEDLRAALGSANKKK
ncbi:MAG: ABC transporter substrate-binding protein [Deltaproteobacteria bacterium]|nr:ABC transporter substrate-binding protein [Deltaproteobacteria bacterium]